MLGPMKRASGALFGCLLLVGCGGAAKPADVPPVVISPESDAGADAMSSAPAAAAQDAPLVLTPACGVALASHFSSLKQPMQLTAYVTKGLWDERPKGGALVGLLRDIERAGAGKISLSVVDPTTESERDAARKAGCAAQPTGVASGDATRSVVEMGYSCLVVAYGGQTDAIKYLPPQRVDGLEFWVANKLREVTDLAAGVKHRIGLLTGHGEIALSEANLVPASMGVPSLRKIMVDNFPHYSLEDVDLKGGSQDLDDALDGLVMTQPEKAISEKELRAIDRFVMKGKRLAVFAGAVNVRAGDASMVGSLDTHGVEKLLLGYGIELRRDAVVDFGSPFRVTVGTASGAVLLHVPSIPRVLAAEQTGDSAETPLDQAFPALFRITELSVPFASSLALAPEKQRAAKLRAVLRTSAPTAPETTAVVSMSPFRTWSPPVGGKAPSTRAVVGAVAEGELKSAFGSDVSPKTAGVFVVAS